MALFAIAAPATAQPLPDTVLATVGPREVPRAEYLRQWERVAVHMVDPGTGELEQKQFFLTQLIEKELLAQAAIDAGYEPTPSEDAQLGVLRLKQMQIAYYTQEIMGVIEETDPEKRLAIEQERYETRVAELVKPLEIAYIDSNLAFLADKYVAMPSPVSQGDGFVKVSVGIDFPKMDLADSSRILATTAEGPFSVGKFWWHWAQLNPADRVRPTSANDVGWWVERFLVQGPMDREARDLGYDRLPEVEDLVRREYEAFATQWYYTEFVLAEVDTNEANLRARWERDPEKYYGTPHYLYRQVWFRSQASADSAIAALRGGSEYMEIIRHRFPEGLDPIGRSRYVDSKLLQLDSPDEELKGGLPPPRRATGSAHASRRAAGGYSATRGTRTAVDPTSKRPGSSFSRTRFGRRPRCCSGSGWRSSTRRMRW